LIGRKTEQRGTSLIEVVLSLGLLAGVLVATASLLVTGRHHAQSGRTASEALSVAQSVLEDIHGWGLHQTYSRFGYDGTATSYVVDTRSNTYAAKWQTLLGQKLDQGYATVEIASLSPTTPPALNATRAIRVIVTVFWDEGQRSRKVRLGTTRL
jgi:type II secretory pathway pseudopilin PulG